MKEVVEDVVMWFVERPLATLVLAMVLCGSVLWWINASCHKQHCPNPGQGARIVDGVCMCVDVPIGAPP